MNSEAVVQRSSFNKVFLEVLQKWENLNLLPVAFFLIKLKWFRTSDNGERF